MDPNTNSKGVLLAADLEKMEDLARSDTLRHGLAHTWACDASNKHGGQLVELQINRH